MTNAQKLEKLGMYEVLVKIAKQSENFGCVVDMLESNKRIRSCPADYDCKKCIGAWLAEEVDHDTRTEVQMQTDL